MGIKVQPMGEYRTNCYIVTVDNKDFIIDPGVNATNWIKKNVNNPVAILNTHGHFDHVWSNKEVSELFNIKIYTPKDDNFMLKDDPYGLNMPKSCADVLVEHDQELLIDNIKVKFHFFPGHTPGCSAIELDGNLFSGDFIFNGSIGRTDFPFSNPKDMKKSLEKILKWDRNIRIFPGHGLPTTLEKEKESLQKWKNYL